MKITASRCLVMLLPLICHPARAAMEWREKMISIQAAKGARDDVRARFEFKNTGARPVTILGLTTSCGCTVANAENSTVAAGKTGRIDALFTIGNRHGRQEKKIVVTTDDPETPETVLTFEIDLPEVSTEPQPASVAPSR